MAKLTTVEDEFEDELKNSCFKSSYISGFSTVESLATTSSSSDWSRSLVGGGRSQWAGGLMPIVLFGALAM